MNFRKKKDLSENTILITIDSKWYLENWNNHFYLNEDGDIKSRTLLFIEFKSILKNATYHHKTIKIYL